MKQRNEERCVCFGMADKDSGGSKPASPRDEDELKGADEETKQVC